MRMAFCLDGYQSQVGVEVRQDTSGIHCVVHGSTDIDRVRRQVARVLSLDFDANVFTGIGESDPVIGRLQTAAPGLRPPLFYSPYEAAVWVVMSARQPRVRMADVRRRLSEAHGATFHLAGESVAALPTPAQLLTVEGFPSISAEKIGRMHGVARAAVDGQLDIDYVQSIGPEAALEHFQGLRGIGRFYASLIVIRACGFADVLPTEERHLLGLVRQLYGLDREPTPSELERLADKWKPLRTWVAVLIRAAGPRVLAKPGEQPVDPMLQTKKAARTRRPTSRPTGPPV
jgi:DNA-3-methyladenine glycosylase II